MKTFLSLVLVCCLSNSVFTQLLVNTNWANETGLPDPNVAWSASIAAGPFGGPITVGNTQTTTQGTNVLTTVIDRSGDIVWQQEWNGADNGNDYATCVAYSDTLIVVGGAVYDTTQAAYDYIILAYHADDGTLLWTQYYNGTGDGHDIPSSIAIAYGNVYVTGASLGNTTLMDYATLCLRSDDGSILWQQRFDYSGRYDAAAKLYVAASKVAVTGASGDAFNDWDFSTVRYNSSTGAFIDENRVENASYYFDQPTDMLQDSLGNIFICGRTENGSGDEDIKVVKLNSALSIVWQRTIDVEGDDDAATAIEIDDTGNTYLTGYYTTPENTKGFLAYKLNTSGTTVWTKKFPAPWGGDFVGTDVSRRGDDYIYTGYLQVQNNTTDMLVYLLDKDGDQKLFTTFDRSDNDEVGISAQFSEDDSFTIYGTSTSALGTVRYLSVRYEYAPRDMEPIVIDSLPAYHRTEMIARFRTDRLNYDFIDDKGLRFARLEDAVTPYALGIIESTLDNERCEDWVVSKIFPYLTSDNETMLNAHGIEVQLPQFYTWLTLSIPKEETIEEIIPLLDAQDKVFVDVSFNSCARPMDEPDDPGYNFYQKSLHEISGTPITINPYHIDMLDAWDYSVGSRTESEGGTNTTVGVFDSGVNQNHIDLNIPDGYDYFYNNGESTATNLNNDIDGHGTHVSGIIGAKRNNFEGVAGIAGGNWDDLDLENHRPGANVINYKILSDSGEIDVPDDEYWGYMDIVFQAMMDASAIGSHPKIDIYNCSWGVHEPVGLPSEMACRDECALMLTVLAQQGSVVVAGSGNGAPPEYSSYPATTKPSGLVEGFEYTGSPNEFVICVGGSNQQGLHHVNSNRGSFVDLIAPAMESLVYTTSNDTTNDAYTNFSGTSAAAPHVSGVCALLHDYMTWSEDAVNAVSVPVAEDYEKIITNSAFDIINDPNEPLTAFYYEGPDTMSGYGILNAKAAMEYVDFSNYKIWHFMATNLDTDTLYEGIDTLLFTQEYNIFPNMIGWNTGRYVCKIYQLNAHPIHNILGETILDYWPLHSQSNTYDLVYEGTPYSRIMQFPQVQVLSCIESAAYLRGYTFYILHPEGQEDVSVNEWYPIHPSETEMAYSIYTTPTVGTQEHKHDWEFSLYPNPANNQLFLKLPRLNSSYINISIHDLSGQLVQSERNNLNKAGNVIKAIDISALAAGVYLCSIESDNQIKTLKFIKQ